MPEIHSYHKTIRGKGKVVFIEIRVTAWDEEFGKKDEKHGVPKKIH